jgi:hypothetical protein
MNVTRALDQIAEIHQQLAKGEVYRGYRPLPMAFSGLAGLFAAAVQPHALGWTRPFEFFVYWSGVATLCGLIASIEIVHNYIVHEGATERRCTRRVVGQFLPALLAGGIVSGTLAWRDPALVVLLPGLWSAFFGLGVFASRPYLPRASGWVALFYLAAGVVLLWLAPAAVSRSPWSVGGTFGAGQLLAALVLYWNRERHDCP